MGEESAVERRVKAEQAIRIHLILPQSGGIGFHVDRIRGGIKAHEAQPAIAPVGVALVVGHNTVDGAPRKRIGAIRLPLFVSRKHQKDIGVVLKSVVNELPLVAKAGIGVENVMAGDDGAAVLVLRQNVFGPIQHNRVWFELILEVENDEVEFAIAKKGVVVVVFVPKAAAVIPAPLKAAGAKILVEQKCFAHPTQATILVVVADGYAIGDAFGKAGQGLLESRHRGRGNFPFRFVACIAPVLHQIAHMGDVDDVVGGLVFP